MLPDRDLHAIEGAIAELNVRAVNRLPVAWIGLWLRFCVRLELDLSHGGSGAAVIEDAVCECHIGSIPNYTIDKMDSGLEAAPAEHNGLVLAERLNYLGAKRHSFELQCWTWHEAQKQATQQLPARHLLR